MTGTADGRSAVDAERIHPRVRAAFTALDGAGVAWALLRGDERLDAPDGDLDILVDPAARDLDGILARAGLVRLPARGHGTHRFYVGYDAGDDIWLRLDVVTEVSFGRLQEFRTDLAPALLRRRRHAGSVAALDPGDGFWHVLLHSVLGRGKVAPHRRDALRSQLGAAAASPLTGLVSGFGQSLASGFTAAVARDDWDAVHGLGRDLRRTWLRRRPEAGIRGAAQAIERRLPATRSGAHGVSIAILGPDGAGKTTLAEGLRASVPIPAKYVYLGIWRQTALEERLRRIVGARLALRLVKLLS